MDEQLKFGATDVEPPWGSTTQGLQKNESLDAWWTTKTFYFLQQRGITMWLKSFGLVFCLVLPLGTPAIADDIYEYFLILERDRDLEVEAKSERLVGLIEGLQKCSVPRWWRIRLVSRDNFFSLPNPLDPKRYDLTDLISKTEIAMKRASDSMPYVVISESRSIELGAEFSPESGSSLFYSVLDDNSVVFSRHNVTTDSIAIARYCADDRIPVWVKLFELPSTGQSTVVLGSAADASIEIVASERDDAIYIFFAQVGRSALFRMNRANGAFESEHYLPQFGGPGVEVWARKNVPDAQ